jgi:NTE family protein
MNAKDHQTLGLALSGGGGRGLAHIGVLMALEEAGLRPDFLAGTSMGGVIAAGYAVGLSPVELEEIAQEFSSFRSLWKLADPTLPRQGFIQGQRLQSFLDREMKETNFDDLQIPLTLTAVDLNTGEEVLLSEGSVAEAVRVTISVPGLFLPIEREGRRLVDGGLLNNLPVDVVKGMGAEVVLAVDVSSIHDYDSYWDGLGQKPFLSATVGDLIRVLTDSLAIMMRQQTEFKHRENPPDILIRPNIPRDVTVVNGFRRTSELIAAGKQSANAIMPDLMHRLS